MNDWIRTALMGIAIAGCAGERIEVGPQSDASTAGADGGPDAPSVGPTDGGAPDVAHPLGADDASDCVISAGWIVFDSDRDAFKRGIFAVRADGTGLTRLTNGPSLEQEPAIAPDGVRMAYASDVDGKSQIYVVDLVTRKVDKVTNRAVAADQPAWSPDGKLLAFHSDLSVFTIRPDGSEETEMATGERGCLCSYQHPVFTMDGLGLLADRNNQIERIELASKARSFVIENGAWRADMPSLSFDGHTLAYVGDCGVTVTPFNTPAYCKQSIAPKGSRPSFGPENALAFEQGTPDQFGPADIYVTVAGCSAPVNVTKNTADDRNARFAPPAFQGAAGVPAPPR